MSLYFMKIDSLLSLRPIAALLVESQERTLFGSVSSSGLAKQKLSLTIHELTVFSSSVSEMCREEVLNGGFHQTESMICAGGMERGLD